MICKFCRGTENLHKDGYNISKNKDHIQQYSCRECKIKRLKKFRKTPEGIEATRKAVRKYEASHPERKNAWNKAQSLKNMPCIVCKEKAHRHHPDPLKPMEIIYLCPLHHKQQHILEKTN